MSSDSGLITMRGLAAFTTGALASVIAGRVLPPIVAQAAGSAQAAAEEDVVYPLLHGHANEEEEVDFPKLRAVLDQKETAMMSGGVQREKALLL